MARKVSVTINGKEYVSAESKKAGQSLNQLGGVSDKVNAAIKAGFVAAAAAVTAAVASITKAVNSSMDLADEVDKMSQKIGISREAFQEWQFIMSQNGMEVSQLQTGVKTLASAAEEASRGVLTYSRTFDALGVSVTDSNGAIKDQEELLFETIGALADVENTTQRTAWATDLLGRSATELAPLLNSGADSIEGLRQKAHELGIVLDDDTIDAGVRLTDTFDQIGRTFKAVVAEAVTPLMGEIDNLGQAFLDQVKEGGGLQRFISGFVRFVSWTIGTGLPLLREGFTFIGGVIGVLANQVLSAFSNIWDSFDDIPILSDLKARIETYIEMSGEIWEALKDGDLKRFWGLVAPIVQDGLAIAAAISLAGLVGSSIWTGIQAVLSGAGFITKGLGVSGAIAGVSLALAISDQITSENGDWSSFAKNVGLALTGAFAAGVLTGNPGAGFMTFTMLLNFKLGEKLFGTSPSFNQNELDEFAQAAASGLKEAYERESGEVEGILNKFMWSWNHEKIRLKSLASGTSVGAAFVEGMGISLEDIDELSKVQASQLLNTFKEVLGIQSPSKEGNWVGQMWTEGIAQGMDDSAIWAMIFENFKNRIQNLKNMGEIDPDEVLGGILGGGDGSGGGDGDGAGGGSEESGGFLKTIIEGIKSFGDELFEAVESLSSFVAIAEWGTTIIQGVMDVLGPAIDGILQPIIGVFRILGQTLGRILLPIFETLGDVTELLAKGFVWFYNKAIVPVANFFIRAFNGVANTLISIVNGVINLINRIPGVNIRTLSLRQEDQGTLTSIAYEDLMRAGESSTSSYSGGNTGSSTSVQRMEINIHQHYNAPVIGDGGMEQVGGFVVRAIQEYTGIGGTVNIVEAS